jgi:hypothetical protein
MSWALERFFHPNILAARSFLDGFIVSPRVEIESGTTDDFSFRNTDHQLVRLHARRLYAYYSVNKPALEIEAQSG